MKETLHNINTNINKIKEIINRFKVYEEIEEFQVLINQLKTTFEQFEKKNKIFTQVNQISSLNYIKLVSNFFVNEKEL